MHTHWDDRAWGSTHQQREEARRRGVTLSVVLSEAVTEAADALREQRRPRFALGRSGVGVARAAAASPDEPVESAAYRA